MKKLSLLSLMFLIFSFANAYGAEIKFKTNSSDQSSALTTSTFKNQVSAGADFIASVNSVNKVYAGTSGLKFGTSSAAGDFIITLADAAQLKNPTITIASAKYKTESTSFEVYLNGATSANATITAGATSDNSFTFSGIVTKIQIKSKGNRAYLSSITIEGEEGGSDLTPTSLAWSAETAIATIGADNTFPTLITTPTDLTGITYASSNTDIATIATDGTITLGACGVTTIMASFAGDDTHKVAADAKYTLTVVNPNAPEYQLFTGNLQAGEYVVYYNKVAMKAAVSSDRLGYETVNPIEDVIQTDNATIIWKIEQNGEYWTLYNTSAGKYAAGNGTKNQAALVSSVSDAALWTVTVSNGKFEFVNKKNAEASVNKNLRYNEGYGFACYGTSTGGALSLYKKVVANDAVTSPIISGNAEFVESTEVTIVAEDGLKVYYTLDGTDPTNESSEYTAPFKLTATTTVKAVAYDGETASEVSSKTFKAITLLTCKEAAELALSVANNNDLVPNGPYAFRGFVTNIAYAYQTGGTMSVWMADTKNGGKVMQAYKFTPEDGNNPPVVGDYLQVVGELTKYNTTPESAAGAIVTKYPAPVVKYTVTLSDNTGGFEPLTSGAGEYEEGAKVTVSAVDSEGWVFVGWMDENGDIVSNDYQYTFVIEGNVALVAIYAQLMALEVNDLQIITEPVFGLLGSAESMPGTKLSFELIVDDSEQGEDGEYYLTENSKVYLNDETELEFLEGIALIDMESKIAQAQVLAAMGETLYLFNLDMSAAPAEPVDLVVTDATIYEEDEILFLTAPWEGKTIKAELPATEHQGWMMIEIHEGEDFSIAMSQNATIATVDNVLTITGVFTDNFTGDIYNVNISGKLPVVEPTTITYELNGGELPLVGPTNAELWEMFKPYYNEYYNLERADQPITSVAVFLSDGMGDDATIFTSEDSDYKWLGDYIIKVTTEQNAALTTLANWKFNAQAFFNANQYTGWPKSADFTEAGKPENWVNVYPDAQEVVLPTEPVAEDYVLPTPTKSGSTFKGWYDNAEGAGEAYTVIPAGWAGTLYAIWKQGPTTALENIAVEGKAVKAIINGQLIIIKNGVQYNAQGQVVK